MNQDSKKSLLQNKSFWLVMVAIDAFILAGVYWWFVRDKQVAEPTLERVEQEVYKPYDSTIAFTKPTQEELRQTLSVMQYRVTQEDGTEPAFNNEYWDNHQDGIYVDVVSGEPLFSSTDKFDSDTGWPSFSKPIQTEAVTTRTDTQLFVPRVEVRSSVADSHLGHIFEDGPQELGGLRYCINSAALRFIPKEKMAELGYEEYLKLFGD